MPPVSKWPKEVEQVILGDEAALAVWFCGLESVVS